MNQSKGTYDVEFADRLLLLVELISHILKKSWILVLSPSWSKDLLSLIGQTGPRHFSLVTQKRIILNYSQARF